jgi:hypothetical protein
MSNQNQRNRSSCLRALRIVVALCVFSLAVHAGEPISVEAASSPSAYVTGPDVVVRVRSSGPIRGSDLRYVLNGLPVKPADPPMTTRVGLVVRIAGLNQGANTLAVRSSGSRPVLLHMTDYPSSGPVFSGPPIPFFRCATVESGLGPPTDENCSVVPRVDYFYHRQVEHDFVPLADLSRRPDDAQVLHLGGHEVPYVVRVESGVINRSIYRIAVLDDPFVNSSNRRWAPHSWNRRLIVGFGGGCGMHYDQGRSRVESVLSDRELSKGFAYLVSTGLVNQQFCSPLLQGETLMMLKEHFVKAYGFPDWTLGTGGSGGAIQQLLLAEMFPGLLDGIQPSGSFPDTQLQIVFDCDLLDRVFRKDDARWSEAKQVAIEGATLATCRDWSHSYAQLIEAVPPIPDPKDKLAQITSSAGGAIDMPQSSCGVVDTRRLYDRTQNPRGLRCSQYDFQVMLLGRDGAGHARRPFDNIGVQYGLGALMDHRISVGDFLDLNEEIGGYDDDGEFVASRSSGDGEAIGHSYSTGLINSGGGGLKLIPIVLQRTYFDNEPAGTAYAIHDRLQDFTIAERLRRANGTRDNLVVWTEDMHSAVDLREMALDLSTRWLDALINDPSPQSEDKIRRTRPPDAVDSCWEREGSRLVEPLSLSSESPCGRLFPTHGAPRVVAGESVTQDVLKCQLKPINPSDYSVVLSESELSRLHRVFPKGVCDFSLPSQYFTPYLGPISGFQGP